MPWSKLKMTFFSFLFFSVFFLGRLVKLKITMPREIVGQNDRSDLDVVNKIHARWATWRQACDIDVIFECHVNEC